MAYSEKRSQEAKNNQEKLRQQLTEEAIHSIRHYTQDPKDLKELADFMAQFHQYSMKNQLLIQSQYKGATAVAGFQQFKRLGYHVNKGAKSIKIFSPIETQYIVPENGGKWIPQKMWTKDQRRQVRNKEVNVQTKLHWKMSSVFDISQTNMPKEEAPKLLPNRLHTFDLSKVKDESKLYQALVHVSQSKGVPVRVASLNSASQGVTRYYPNDVVEIILSNRLDSTNRIPTLIHEMSHAFMNHGRSKIAVEAKEFQAEFSSYMTCRAFNIDTSEESFPYIADWTNRLNDFTDKEIVDFLEETEKVSRDIIRLTNNEWDRLTAQEKERKQEERVHHVESYERQEPQAQDEKKDVTDPERSALDSSIGTVLFTGATTLDMIQKAKEEPYSKLTFKIDGQDYLLITDKKAGESSLITHYTLPQQQEPERIIGKEKNRILTQIEEAGYLPMTAKAYEEMDQLKAEHRYPSQQDYPFLYHSTPQDREKFNRLNQDYDPKTGLLNQPFISIEWSEHDALRDGQILTLDEANRLMNQLGESEEEGYFKTQLNLHTTPNEYHSTRIDMGKGEDPFDEQLYEHFSNQMDELEIAQIAKETQTFQDHEEWEPIKVQVEFKGHQFQYDIQVNHVNHDVKGTYTRDQDAPKEATEKSCLNAIQYVLKNHKLDEAERHLLEKTIEEAQKRQQRIQLYEENQKRIHQMSEETKETQTVEAQSTVQPSSSMPFDEKIKMARQVNILSVAEAYGIHLTKDSRDQYRDMDNHSMVFTPSKNSFYENNGNFGGDPISFAQKVMGITSFKDAVNYLVSGDYGQVTLTKEEKKPFEYDASKESKHFDKARQYLVNERCLHPDLVDALHQKGYIRQDKRNNVLFLWNEKGRIVGCAEQGTVKMKEPLNGRDHWKAIQKNSESYNGYAFNFRNGDPKHLKFFESDIDALSYASIYGLEKDTQYIAMDGLKDHIVAHYAQNAMEVTQNQVESIQLCVDHDEAGKAFAQKFDSLKQEGKPVKVEYNAPEIPSELQNQVDKWDWNNECQYRCHQHAEASLLTQHQGQDETSDSPIIQTGGELEL